MAGIRNAKPPRVPVCLSARIAEAATRIFGFLLSAGYVICRNIRALLDSALSEYDGKPEYASCFRSQ
jgi:hypothetical protein